MTPSRPIPPWPLLALLALAACGRSAPASSEGRAELAPADRPATAISLSRGAPMAKDVDRFPRIDAPGGPMTAKINLILNAADRRVHAQIAECKANAKDSAGGADWQRQVGIKLAGPGFLSLLDSNAYFCGGAHPEDAVGFDTFDLSTGDPVDWRAYLLADLVGQPRVFDDFNGLPATQISAPALLAWYRRAALAQMDPQMRGDCADAYAADDLHVELYLDAKHAALAVQTDSFPHVIAACVETAYMDVAELRRRGAKPALTDALEAAHAAGHWAPDPPKD